MRSIERSHGNPKHVLNEIPLAILPPDAHFNPPLKFSFKFGGRRRKGLKGLLTKGRRLLVRAKGNENENENETGNWKEVCKNMGVKAYFFHVYPIFCKLAVSVSKF